jgi:hypothetical protein
MVDFAVESLAAARVSDGAQRLLDSQWSYTGDSEVESRPNWNLYQQMEARNALLLVVARQDGRAVGYLIAAIYPHPNAVQELIASIPTYTVEERPGRALIMSRMVDFALQQLAARGVFKVDIETHAEYSAGRLWELKGFKVSRIGYTLKLKARPEMRHA